MFEPKKKVLLIDADPQTNLTFLCCDMARWQARKVIAREIQEHLNEIAREKQQPYFVGRTADIEEMQRLLSPIDGSVPPRTVAIIGLPGIGRRAFIKHTSRSLLNIRRQLIVRIQDGDSISDLALKTADQVEPYTSDLGLEKIKDQIVNSSEAAEMAVALKERAPFEMLSQLSLCEIRLGNLDEAEELLARLDKEFRRIREDIRINLRCKLELARKRYNTVLALSSKNPKKDSKFFKDIRRKALAGELEHAALDDSMRDKYEVELRKLNDDLKTIDARELEMLE
jgi:hypothetical protein